MKPTEAAALLTIAAAYDNRKPDPDAAKAWAMALDGLRFEDCREAIVTHYRHSREWMMPVDVVTGVKALRRNRVLAFGPLPEPPASIDPNDTAAYSRWLDETTRAIADGRLERQPEGPPAAIERRDVIAELGHVGTSVADDNRNAVRAAREAAAEARKQAQAAAKPEPEPLLGPEDHSREPEPDPTPTEASR
jgi:hypothetical protein